MRTKIFVLIITFFIVTSFNEQVFCQEKSKPVQQKQNKIESNTKKQSKKIWNSLCPVMGDPVDPSVKTVEYKGKVIGFCCKSCIKKFQKDQEKYFKRISPDGKSLIN